MPPEVIIKHQPLIMKKWLIIHFETFFNYSELIILQSSDHPTLYKTYQIFLCKYFIICFTRYSQKIKLFFDVNELKLKVFN
jgi:hypothetical protein